MLVVFPTEHILRCFLFERTTEKAMDYLWRAVMPLYRPSKGIVLNYSSKIPKNAQKFNLDRPLDDVSQDVLKVITDRDFRYLQRIRGPKEFLEHISWMIGNATITFRLDLALTHYMLGNVLQCRKLIAELASDGQASSSNKDIISALNDELRANPADVALKIRTWEKANILNLGLTDIESDIRLR